jgi:hypothetical protein
MDALGVTALHPTVRTWTARAPLIPLLRRAWRRSPTSVAFADERMHKCEWRSRRCLHTTSHQPHASSAHSPCLCVPSSHEASAVSPSEPPHRKEEKERPRDRDTHHALPLKPSPPRYRRSRSRSRRLEGGTSAAHLIESGCGRTPPGR